MFWFLVSVVLLVIWLSERSSLKKQNTENYNRGWWDGYKYLKGKIGTAATKEQLAAIYETAEEGLSEEQREETLAVDTQDASLYNGLLISNSDETDTQVQTVTEQPVVQEHTPLNAEEIAAEKEQRTLKNLNILLYVGSFLIVAAMAVFVTLVMPANIKLASLILVTLGFYVSGMAVYSRSQRLKPAAVAFVGTGLAVLPFLGFALTSLGNMSPTTAWFIASIAGLVLYGTAAVRLQSQLVSYLTMAYVLSLSLSSVSTLQLGIMWYFIAAIAVATVCTSIHYLLPNRLPQIFWQPVEQTGLVLTPIALVASMFVASMSDLFMYEVLFGLATVYYVVAWLESRQKMYELAARVLAHVSVLIWGYDVFLHTSSNQTMFALLWLSAATAQVLYSLLRVRNNDANSRSIEQGYIGAGIGVQLVGVFLWIGVPYQNEYISLTLFAIGAAAAAAAVRLRVIGWLYTTLAISVTLPFMLGRMVLHPPLDYGSIAAVFAAAAVIGLAILERIKAGNASQNRQQLIIAGTLTYVVATIGAGLLSGSSATIGWTMLVAAAILVTFSYITKEIALEVVGSVSMVWGVAAVVYWLGVSAEWRVVAATVAASVLLVAATVLHHVSAEKARRDSVAIVAAAVFACLAFVPFGGSTEATYVAIGLLTAAAVVMFGLRAAMLKTSNTVLQHLTLASYGTYLALAFILAMSTNTGLGALVAIIATIILWAGSYSENSPPRLLIGNVMLLLGLSSGWAWLEFPYDWAVYGVLWIAAALYYVFYWIAVSSRDVPRTVITFWSLLAALGIAALVRFPDGSQWVIPSALSLLALAGVIGAHGYILRRNNFMEAAAYIATASLQRMVAMWMPELTLPLYAHWWALMIMLAAVLRKQYHIRAIIALAFITGATGIYALIGDPGYQLLFLIEHLAVAIVAALMRKQWAMWWGIIATVVAVVYFLRNYTAFALLFIGLLLIVFVIWRLLRTNKKP